jgi:hypothetical protein
MTSSFLPNIIAHKVASVYVEAVHRAFARLVDNDAHSYQ